MWHEYSGDERISKVMSVRKADDPTEKRSTSAKERGFTGRKVVLLILTGNKIMMIRCFRTNIYMRVI